MIFMCPLYWWLKHYWYWRSCYIDILWLTIVICSSAIAISYSSLVKRRFFKREIFVVCSCCKCKCEPEKVVTMHKFCFRMLQHHFNTNVSLLVCSCVFSNVLGREIVKEGKSFRMTLDWWDTHLLNTVGTSVLKCFHKLIL